MTSDTTSSAQAFATVLASALCDSVIAFTQGSFIPVRVERLGTAVDMIRGWTIEARIGGVHGFLRFNDNAEGGIDFRCEVDEIEAFGTITKVKTGYAWEVEAIEANNCHPSTLRIVATFIDEMSLASPRGR
jgi:hypothetical protein